MDYNFLESLGSFVSCDHPIPKFNCYKLAHSSQFGCGLFPDFFSGFWLVHECEMVSGVCETWVWIEILQIPGSVVQPAQGVSRGAQGWFKAI